MNDSIPATVRCVVFALVGNVKKMAHNDWPMLEESTRLREDLHLDAADITELAIKLEYETVCGLDPNHIAYKCETIGDVIDYTAGLVRKRKAHSK